MKCGLDNEKLYVTFTVNSFFSEMDQVADELSSVLVFHNEDCLNLNQRKHTAFPGSYVVFHLSKCFSKMMYNWCLTWLVFLFSLYFLCT